jgi:hypothetical protein
MMNTIRDQLLTLWMYTTKGDLLVAASSTALLRLPIGGNGNVLKARPAAATPIAWEAMTHAELTGVGTNTHTQIDNFISAAPNTYAPIAKGVTNGDTHNHAGGDGAQISHYDLSNTGTVTGHVTGGNAHDHSGGDGAQISHLSLADVGNNTGHVTGGNEHNHIGGDGAQLDHYQLSHIGTKTHDEIDSHVNSTILHSQLVSGVWQNTGWDGDAKSDGVYTMTLDQFNAFLSNNIKLLFVRLQATWAEAGINQDVWLSQPGDDTRMTEVRAYHGGRIMSAFGVLIPDENGSFSINVSGSPTSVLIRFFGYLI